MAAKSSIKFLLKQLTFSLHLICFLNYTSKLTDFLFNATILLNIFNFPENFFVWQIYPIIYLKIKILNDGSHRNAKEKISQYEMKSIKLIKWFFNEIQIRRRNDWMQRNGYAHMHLLHIKYIYKCVLCLYNVHRTDWFVFRHDKAIPSKFTGKFRCILTSNVLLVLLFNSLTKLIFCLLSFFCVFFCLPIAHMEAMENEFW